MEVLQAVKVDTAFNLADIFTKCTSTAVRKNLMEELVRIARQISVAI